MIDAIIAVGRYINAQVMAEAVEMSAQLTMLRDHGCDSAQGFIFSEPLALEQINASLVNSNPGRTHNKCNRNPRVQWSCFRYLLIVEAPES